MTAQQSPSGRHSGFDARLDFGVDSDCQFVIGDRDLPVSASSDKIKCVWLELLAGPPESSFFKYLSHTIRYLPSSDPREHCQ